jgi:uridine phosphorylase
MLVSWSWDPSAPLVTPEQNAEYVRERLDLGDAEWRLPTTLIATFQQAAWKHLTAGCGIPEAARRGAEIMPVVGAVNGVPVAAVRMMLGAPAAALSLEAGIARGVRDVLIVGSAGSLRDDLPVDAIRRHREAGVLVVEMEAAAIFAVARVRGIRSALIVAVSDELCHPDWKPGFGDERYADTLLAAADAVLACAGMA